MIAAPFPKIIAFPNAKPRLMESPDPEPAQLHGIRIGITSAELDAWGSAANAADLPFSKLGLETLRRAAAHSTGRKRRWNAIPPGDFHHIAIMLTEADDKAFRAQAKASGVPVEIWARMTLKAVWDAKGGQA